MPSANRRTIAFVRALLPAGEGSLGSDATYRVSRGDRPAALPERQVTALASAGVLSIAAGRCRALPEARSWLRRQLADCDPHAAQHRHELRTADGRLINLAESPLARLAVPSAGETEAFLAPHQVEAGERLRRLAERAQLQSRITMSYDSAHVASKGSGALDISDMAVDARRALDDIARALPGDCAGVVFDVCGLLKGLQLVETERGWPRRSAKLVLRIGLDQLARHFGLEAVATGQSRSGRHAWIEGGRPAMFG